MCTGAVTVRLVPISMSSSTPASTLQSTLRQHESGSSTTVIMSSQTSEARTVPVIQSVAESAPPSTDRDHEPGVHFLTDDQNGSLLISRSDDPECGTYEPDGGGGGGGVDGGGVVNVGSGCSGAGAGAGAGTSTNNITCTGTSAPITAGCIANNNGSALNNTPRNKSELLEYLIRDDGSVTCKLCGEVLASRTHWYRHKYKLHVSTGTGSTVATPATIPPAAPPAPLTTSTSTGMSPSPLFRCTHCNVFFKSRKGYMGHVSARHPTDGDDEGTVLPEASDATGPAPASTNTLPLADGPAKAPRRKDSCVRNADWEQQREKEEKLVADIIDRVRRECEAQGAAVSRRGYSRRSTVMNTCN